MDGFIDQYCYAKMVYLFTMLASMFQVMIDCLIHAPRHVKDEVDGLNATSKKCIHQAIATMQKQQGSNQQQIAAWAIKNGACGRFCVSISSCLC
jgi:hypothetical protein